TRTSSGQTDHPHVRGEHRDRERSAALPGPSPRAWGKPPQRGDEVPCRARRRRQCCCPSQGRSTGTTLPAPRPRRGRIRRPLRSAGDQVGGGDQAAAAPVVGGRGGVEATHERRSEEHTSELQSRENLVCRLLLEKKKPHER